MNTLGDYIEDLKEDEMMSIEGGKFLEQDFGYDLGMPLAGYCLRWARELLQYTDRIGYSC